jgi:hypothetical protein
LFSARLFSLWPFKNQRPAFRGTWIVVQHTAVGKRRGQIFTHAMSRRHDAVAFIRPGVEFPEDAGLPSLR